MTTFKSAKNMIKKEKKENNNKDYRIKRNKFGSSFWSQYVDFNYVLRTKYGIFMNHKNLSLIPSDYGVPFPYFEEHTAEENELIRQETINYTFLDKIEIASRDKTHTKHSKEMTKMRRKARNDKLFQYSFDDSDN